MRAVLLDTGPVVGLLHDRDVHHDTAITALTQSVEHGRALITTWEVVGEAFTLIRTRLSATGRSVPAMTVLDWAEEGGAMVVQSADADQRRAVQILRLHRDLRLSYVDALVLAIADRLGVEEVLTVDAHLSAVDLGRGLLVTVV